MSQLPVSLSINIPFLNNNHALIAQKSLSPDPMLKPDTVNVQYKIKNNSILNIVVNGIDDRVIRVTVNNLLENLKTIIECFETF